MFDFKVLYLRQVIVFLLVFASVSGAQAQERIGTANKGKMYILWGWNNGYYSNSDIHFTGDNYDFELKDVVAADNQTSFSWDVYFNPATITIPQTNFRAGYFINDNLNIAVGVDHMKYFMTNNQTVKINGYINQSGTGYDGVYYNEDIALTPDFLSFEHSDGLNYINAEVNYVQDILTWVGSPKEKLQVYLTGGAGLGMLLPKTNAQLMGQPRHDDFNVAGYGMSLKGGINVTFFKYFFVQGEVKGGYINMPNIRTTENKSDRASQQFFYSMPAILFGAVFKITNK